VRDATSVVHGALLHELAVLLLWRVEVSLVLRVGTAVTLNIGSNRTRGVARSATTSRGRYENARRALGAPVLVSGAFVLAACTNSAGSVSVRGDAGTSTEAGKSAGIPGYVHTLARSRFVIGKITGETDEFGMHKIIGDDGVFATEIVSQGVTAIPDFEVPSPTGQYFPGGYVAQNAEVVSYLTGAGLPADQILSVTDDETGVSRWSGGDSGDIFDPKNVVVVTWFTVFHRGYEGVPIEDSTAWAIQTRRRHFSPVCLAGCRAATWPFITHSSSGKARSKRTPATAASLAARPCASICRAICCSSPTRPTAT
jgi:hypothetical protein